MCETDEDGTNEQRNSNPDSDLPPFNDLGCIVCGKEYFGEDADYCPDCEDGCWRREVEEEAMMEEQWLRNQDF